MASIFCRLILSRISIIMWWPCLLNLLLPPRIIFCGAFQRPLFRYARRSCRGLRPEPLHWGPRESRSRRNPHTIALRPITTCTATDAHKHDNDEKIRTEPQSIHNNNNNNNGNDNCLITSDSQPLSEPMTAGQSPKTRKPRRNNYNNSHRQRISIDLKSYEEKEKREMEWLVDTTTKFLGFAQDEASTKSQPQPQQQKQVVVGFMSHNLTRRAVKLMKAWARRSTEPHVVELILKRLINEFEAGNKHVQITTGTYNVVLEVWSKSSDDGAAERAETILNEMEKQYAQGNKNVKPNIKSYNAVMMAYVLNRKKSKHDALPKVQAIFDRLLGEEREGEKSDRAVHYNSGHNRRTLLPNRISYELLLRAIANSSQPDAGEQAENVFQAMLNRYNAGEETLKPDINCYNQVVFAWSRSGSRIFDVVKVEQIFHEIMSLQSSVGLYPNVDTFNHLLGACLKSNDPSSLRKMEAMLSKMEASFGSGNKAAKPDRYTINTIMAAYAKDGMVDRAALVGENMEKKYNILPDAVSKNILVDSWSRSGSKGAWKAFNMLIEMEAEFIAGNIGVKPNSYTYSSVIHGFTMCGGEDSANHAHACLERMRELHSNHGGDAANEAVYNAGINAWASSGSDLGAERAQSILREMEERHGDDPFVPKPNTVSYNTFLKALSNGRGNNALLAETYLRSLEEKMKHDKDLAPDAVLYTAVITAFARSYFEDKAEKAYSILLRMITAYKKGNSKARPNIFAFNSCLNACAFVNGDPKKKVEAFAIMVATTVLLNQYSNADHITYGTILRACSTLLPPGDKRRETLVESVFQKAAKSGQVSSFVLTQMKFAADANQYQDLLRRNIDSAPHTNDLPPDWTYAVRDNSRRR